MTAYVLILTLLIQSHNGWGGYTSNVQVTVVQGFRTQESCMVAGRAVMNTNLQIGVATTVVCSPQ